MVEEPKIIPAVMEVPTDEDEETIRESDLPHHFTNGKAPAKGAAPSVPASKAPKLPSASAKPAKDVQLDKAIELLKHWKSYQEQLAKSDSIASK